MSRVLSAALIAALVATACDRSHAGRTATRPPPSTEFVIGARDSMFWVTAGPPGVRVRGSPILLARYGGKFYEIFVADDDFSYQDALMVGERMYRRDLVSGDSAVVFADTVIPRIAQSYAQAHPDERPLDRDEETNADPETSATAELDVLDTFGPYLSYEYHADVERRGRALWHTTRRGVLDLRSGKPARMSELFGEAAARKVVDVGRRAYEAARDSMLRIHRSTNRELRAADVIAHARFDESSFALDVVDDQPVVRFAVPGRGEGPAGNMVELDPISVDVPAWWRDLADGIPESNDSVDVWTRAGVRVLARYDTSGEMASVSLSDPAGTEWPLRVMAEPLHRIDWLDAPAFDSVARRALGRAFNEAASYDERSRIAAGRGD